MKVATIFTVLATSVFADAPVVEHVKTTVLDAGGWRFDVTLSHPDTGWDHYADGWAVVDSDGRDLGLRELAHPHETEQPFTRSLAINGPLPEVVYLNARCSVDGWAEHPFEVTLR